MINGPVWVVGAFWSWAKPHLVIEFWGRRLIGRISKSGHYIAEIAVLNRDQFSDLSFLNQITGPLEIGAGAVLNSDLNDAFVSSGHINHPAPFLDEKSQRFFAINIFAGSTRHHCHQRMPMVGSRHDDSIDIFAFKEFSKIRKLFATTAGKRGAGFEPGSINVSHPNYIDVALLHETVGVNAPD